MPERDIESLGVMGWGLDAARRFFRRRRRRRRRPPNFKILMTNLPELTYLPKS